MVSHWRIGRISLLTTLFFVEFWNTKIKYMKNKPMFLPSFFFFFFPFPFFFFGGILSQKAKSSQIIRWLVVLRFCCQESQKTQGDRNITTRNLAKYLFNFKSNKNKKMSYNYTNKLRIAYFIHLFILIKEIWISLQRFIFESCSVLGYLWLTGLSCLQHAQCGLFLLPNPRWRLYVFLLDANVSLTMQSRYAVFLTHTPPFWKLLWLIHKLTEFHVLDSSQTW